MGTIIYLTDTDDDGINDGEEVENGSDPLDPNDSNSQDEPNNSVSGFPLTLFGFISLLFIILILRKNKIELKK